MKRPIFVGDWISTKGRIPFGRKRRRAVWPGGHAIAEVVEIEVRGRTEHFLTTRGEFVTRDRIVEVRNAWYIPAKGEPRTAGRFKL